MIAISLVLLLQSLGNPPHYLKPKGADGKVIGADEHMVMDVQLKKAYATGWMGNVEGGYGLPDDRYLGRAFGLGYRDKARFSAFANLNNIKNTQIGRSSGQWSGGWPQDGELDVKMGGADYYFSRGRAWVGGDVLITHEEPKVEQKQSAVSFFNSGDVYERLHSVSRERKFLYISRPYWINSHHRLVRSRERNNSREPENSKGLVPVFT